MPRELSFGTQKPVQEGPKCATCGGSGVINSSGVKWRLQGDQFRNTKPCPDCEMGEWERNFRLEWMEKFPEDYKASEVML